MKERPLTNDQLKKIFIGAQCPCPTKAQMQTYERKEELTIACLGCGAHVKTDSVKVVYEMEEKR